MTELRIVPLDPRLHSLATSFEGKVRYAAHYHGLEAGPLVEKHSKKSHTYTIQILSTGPGGRRIGEVSHVQSRGGGSRPRIDAYTVTRTGGQGSYGQNGIKLGWLKAEVIEKRKPPKLRVVTADDVLGR